MTIKKIIVVGGGAMGMFASSAIKKNCPDIDVTVVHDPNTPYIGVGESIGWNGQDFMKQMFGLEESQWLKKSQSTYKLGIAHYGFDNTDRPHFNIHKWNPSAKVATISITGVHRDNQLTNAKRRAGWPALGDAADNITLADAWLHLYHKGFRTQDTLDGDLGELYWYCKYNTFPSKENYSHQRVTHSYHFNAEYIKDVIHELVGIPSRVKVIEGKVDQVITDGQKITHIKVNDTLLSADLFVDCTGFRRLLATNIGCKWITLPDYFNNSALVGQSVNNDNNKSPITSYTEHHAMDHGWLFSIPMPTRAGNGYVFNSARTADVDLIQHEFNTKFSFKANAIARLINWKPGYIKNTFVGNCVIMGVGSMFVDPYDANNFSTQMSMLQKFVTLLLQDRDYHTWSDQYNRYVNGIADDSIFRIETGMFLAPKQDTQYWKDNHQIGIKLRLREKLNDVIMDGRRRFLRKEQDLFWFQGAHLAQAAYYQLDLPKPNIKMTVEDEQLALNFFKFFNEKNRIQASCAQPVKDFYKQLYI